MSKRWTSRRVLMAALVCTGFLTLPRAFGQVIAPLDGALFDPAGAQVDPPGCLVGGEPGPGPINPGEGTTFTCSFSTSTSTTENTVEADEHQTRVTAVRDGTVVFDQTVDAPPGSPAVQALEVQAAAALAGPGCTSTPVTVVDSSRTPTGSSTAETTDVEEIATLENTIGATGVTIQIGDRDTGGVTFAVLPGTENFNFHTDFHTETLRTTTNTFLSSQHRQVSGTCAGAPPPVVVPAVTEAPAAVPVSAMPRTAG
jgi:hypothetical protein